MLMLPVSDEKEERREGEKRTVYGNIKASHFKGSQDREHFFSRNQEQRILPQGTRRIMKPGPANVETERGGEMML